LYGKADQSLRASVTTDAAVHPVKQGATAAVKVTLATTGSAPVDEPVTVAARSAITFGAPQCAGLRVSVGAGRRVRFRTGGYSETSLGLATIAGVGARVDFRGNRHAGGVQTPSAIVLPRGRTRVQVVVPSATTTTVRVRAGAVVVAPRIRGSTYGRRIVVRAGHGVRCVGRVCR